MTNVRKVQQVTIMTKSKIENFIKRSIFHIFIIILSNFRERGEITKGRGLFPA